jgi:hypothetical protein
MNKQNIIKYALVNALWTALYIILIGTFLYSAPAVFGHGQNALIPVVMLLLFVFSAALCGALVLGRPILWYWEGNKKEAILLFAYTLAILFVVTIVMLIVLYVLNV